jgi:phosphoglycolate phosphatase
MTTLPKPRAILFDWDNTLVNTWPMIHTALNMTLSHMGHPQWTIERVKSDVKKSMRDSFPAMFGEQWKDAAAHYQQSYRSIHLDHLAPLADAAKMLAAIARPDVFVGIVSNKMGSTLRKELAHLAWEDFFDIAIGAGDAARDKPDPDPVLLALNGSDITPAADVWFIGDSGIDLEVAKNTGCTAILYGDFHPENRLFEGFPFAAHARDHAMLRTWIQAHA